MEFSLKISPCKTGPCPQNGSDVSAGTDPVAQSKHAVLNDYETDDDSADHSRRRLVRAVCGGGGGEALFADVLGVGGIFRRDAEHRGNGARE